MSSETIDTRRRILQAAWDLLEDDRKNGVKMSDIAKAAGISRQAVYLHFPTRAELLIAVTLFIDDMNDVDTRLQASRDAGSGEERLEAFIDAWANYIPEIHGCATALIAMQDTDNAAREAWSGRLAAIRKGFEAAVSMLDREGRLSPDLTTDQATDILCALISVESWDYLTRRRGWTQAQFFSHMQHTARKLVLAS